MVTARQSASRTRSWGRTLSYVQDAALISLSALFVYVHLQLVVNEHRLTSVGFAVEQSLLVGMFLTRRRSIKTSSRPIDWVFATGGWLSLLARPADSPGEWASTMGIVLQLLGLTGTCIAFGYLGKSFGVVAANRGLKVNGPYRFVRHPIYLTHSITATGFTLANPSPWNVGILLALTFFQVMRMRAEERVLTETSDYAQYADRVRWRLLPGIY